MTDEPIVTMLRSFEASPRRVYAAWTEARHVAQWWGPHGFTVPLCEMDVRPGGAFRIHMRGPDGTVHRTKGQYHEVVEPDRLVLTDGFEDEPKPTGDMTWTVTFDPHGADATDLRIHLRCQSIADRDTILRMGWRDGTAEMLDRLAAYLPKVR